MNQIKFGTDGWRGIIAKDFTLSDVARFAHGLSRWLTGRFRQPSAVVGYDTRFGGEMFLEAVAKVLASKGIRVFIAEKFVTTPMVSLGVIRLKADCGVMITASHNPPEYNGIKLKGKHGGPMTDGDIKDIENLISGDYEMDLEMLNWNYFIEQGLIQHINLETIYIKNLMDHLNLQLIRESGMNLVFDAMHGSAQDVIRKVLPEVNMLHGTRNPSFEGIPPEPAGRNLHELEELLINNKNISSAIAVDGDGDRISLYDDRGAYLDSHHCFLLLIHYLAKYKSLTGKILTTVTTTAKLDKLCAFYGLEVERLPVGFNHISARMLKDSILAAGEESGGLTTGDYLPERDAVWTGLLLWQWLAESGRKLSDLMQEIYDITGPFACERMDIGWNKKLRNQIIENCEKKFYKWFGRYEVRQQDCIDGYLFRIDEERRMMIRASGTEPLIRIYAEAPDADETSALIQAVAGEIEKS